MNWYERSEAAANYIKDKLFRKEPAHPQRAVILGSGADIFLDSFELVASCTFDDIPHLASTTFHQGTIHLAKIDDDNTLLIINGRLHYYEGYSIQEVCFPIRILQQLGIKSLFMTNASGGLNPSYRPGEIILVKDHINLMPEHPLRGPNDDRLGLRFPDMSDAYSESLRTQLKQSWKKLHKSPLKEGVYVGFQGPSLETPAEYRYLNIIGGDMVGMSTVPEVIVANHAKIEVAVLSIVTNLCYPPEVITPTTVEEVKAMAAEATPDIAALLKAVLLDAAE